MRRTYNIININYYTDQEAHTFIVANVEYVIYAEPCPINNITTSNIIMMTQIGNHARVTTSCPNYVLSIYWLCTAYILIMYWLCRYWLCRYWLCTDYVGTDYVGTAYVLIMYCLWTDYILIMYIFPHHKSYIYIRITTSRFFISKNVLAIDSIAGSATSRTGAHYAQTHPSEW